MLSEVQPESPRSAAVGLLLNLLFPGLGFAYLGYAWWNAVWTPLFCVAVFVPSFREFDWGFNKAVVLQILCQLHYAVMFDWRLQHGKPRHASNAAYTGVATIFLIMAGLLSQPFTTVGNRQADAEIGLCGKTLQTSEAIYKIEHGRYTSKEMIQSFKCPDYVDVFETVPPSADNYAFLIARKTNDDLYYVDQNGLRRVRGVAHED